VEASNETNDKVFPIKTVLPAEQTTAQAKSELERRDIKPETISNMYHSSTKRSRTNKRKKSVKKIKTSGKRKKKVSGRKKVQKGLGKRSRKHKCKKVGSKKRDIFEIN